MHYVINISHDFLLLKSLDVILVKFENNQIAIIKIDENIKM